ncbi:MAG TPA: GTP cyclohydrolase I FolE [bacterium]|nr:GTP cyclohydrolase I FolE [bacterium]HPP86834.1 GTP cyclohydrolase I FolE [bacterium]
MDTEKIKQGVRLILEGIGEDLEREGLKETPDRVARMYLDVFSGLKKEPEKVFKIFKEEKHEELVMVKDIPFFSFCEHHLLPFIGSASVAYIPENSMITGISKLARIVDIYSKRPQLQERLTTQIADTLMKVLKPKGVLVIIEAEHLCMTIRGIKKPGAVTITSALRGIFRADSRTRTEALELLRKTL